MPLLRSGKDGGISEYGFGEIASMVFTNQAADTVSDEAPIPLLYDYFLMLPSDPTFAKVQSYFEAYNIPIPDGYQLAPLTIQQQIEIQEMVMDIFLLKGLSEAFMRDYDNTWIKPLRDQLILPNSSLVQTSAPAESSILVTPSETLTETASTSSVPISTTTNAVAPVAIAPVESKLTAKMLAHPLAELLKNIGK